MSANLALRLMSKKLLWLLRVRPDDFHRITAAECFIKYNPLTQNLDVVEMAAVFASLPVNFKNDPKREKEKWRAELEGVVNNLIRMKDAGKLHGNDLRHSAYKDHPPSFANNIEMLPLTIKKDSSATHLLVDTKDMIKSSNSWVLDGILTTHGVLGDTTRDVKVKIVTLDKEAFLQRELEILKILCDSKHFVCIRHHELISCEEVTVAARDYSSNICFNKHVAMVMEKGTITLDNYLLQHGNELSHADRLQLVTSLISIVKDAHKSKIVLMDIKGSNVMLFVSDTGFNTWKGIDLGGSLPVDTPLDHSSFMATVSYMSPELLSAGQKSGLQAKYSMDIWSLGVLIFNVLIRNQNQKFWNLSGANSDADIIRTISTGGFTQSTIDDHIDRNFPGSSKSSQRRFLQRMLQKDPVKRSTIESLQESAVLDGRTSISASTVYKGMGQIMKDIKILQTLVTAEFSHLRSKFDSFLDADDSGDLKHMIFCFESLRDMLERQAQSTEDCKAAIHKLACWQAPSTVDIVPPALSDFMEKVTTQLSQLLTVVDQQNIDEAERKKLLKQLSEEVNTVQEQIKKVSDDIDSLHVAFNKLGKRVRDALISNGKQHNSDVQKLITKLTAIDKQVQLTSKADKAIKEWEILKQHIVDVGHSTKDINERVATNTRLLRTLVQNTHNVPTLMVLLPVSKKGFKKFDPRNLLRDQAKLVFICGYTMELVQCGPKKNGYSVKDLKTWVIKAVPVLKVGLLLLQIGLMSTGIPIPLLGMADAILGPADKLSYLNYARDLLQPVDSAIGPASDALEKPMGSAVESVKRTAQSSFGLIVPKAISPEAQGLPLKSLGSTLDSLESSSDRIVQAIRALEGEDRDNMRSAYEAVGSFLGQEDPFLTHVGLVKKITDSGKVAWVNNDPTVIEQFMKNDGVFPWMK